MRGQLSNLERARPDKAEPARDSRAGPALLIDACRVTPAPAGDAPDPDPGQPVTDWDWLLAAAERHAVTPLLARRLAAQPCGAPPHILATLRARFDENALRNIVLTRMLAELLQRLAGQGVDAMPIKGPALAISAYGDLALRVFGDLDIVVRPPHFDRARSLFAEWGYRPLVALTSAAERKLRASDHHLPLVSEENGQLVELHWSLDNGRLGSFLGGEWVWSNARRVSLLGRELPALSWSALLVYLCVHGAKHGWLSLGWIRDVAGVLSAAPPGELREAREIAAAAGAARRLELGIALSHELLGAPVPEGLEPSGQRSVALLVEQVRSALFAGSAPGMGEWMVFQCRTLDSVRDRAGYFWHVIAAPHVADVEAVALPGWLSGLYYIVRPLRLVARRAGAIRASRLFRPGGP